VKVHSEKEYSYNLVGFKGKVNTLEGIKEKVRSLVPSFLIKLSQVLSPWTQEKFEPKHIKSS